MQSVRCTDTPLPRVTNPVILSPGTGVQHFDSRAQTSADPSTLTPESPGATCGVVGRVRTVASAMSSCAPASPPAAFTSLLTTFWALTCPSPTAAYRAARSWYRSSCAIAWSAPAVASRCSGRPCLRIVRAIIDLPVSAEASRRSLENQCLILLRALALLT